MGHPKRLENMLGDVLLERFSANSLHNVAGQPHSVIRITRNGAWCEKAVRLIFDQKIAQRQRLFGLDKQYVPDFLLESAGMRHQISQRDRFAKGRTNLEVQIII